MKEAQASPPGSVIPVTQRRLEVTVPGLTGRKTFTAKQPVTLKEKKQWRPDFYCARRPVAMGCVLRLDGLVSKNCNRVRQQDWNK